MEKRYNKEDLKIIIKNLENNKVNLVNIEYMVDYERNEYIHFNVETENEIPTETKNEFEKYIKVGMKG